jgi:UDP-N-acetyl-L-fucosamine synthase
MTIVGTRPELIKLAAVIGELGRSFEHILVHTGQNFDFELNEIFFKDLDIPRPQYFLNCAGDTALKTIGNVLGSIEPILDKEKPDAVLIYGDTNSALAALAVKKKQIPLFHMEAGNRCFDQRVPEEINRRIVDHLSDINMPLTEAGRRNLLREGLPAERIFKTGSCMFEILRLQKAKIEQSDVLNQLKLKPRKYFVVSSHREENVDDFETLGLLIESLNALAAKFNFPIIYSVHPRTKRRLAQGGLPSLHDLVRDMAPLGFSDYVKLQVEATAVLSDSGTLMEESAILGFPAVHIRRAYERPEGMEHGVLLISDIAPEKVIQAVDLALADDRRGQEVRVEDYRLDHVSKTVARIIFSHTSQINRTVWFRDK